MAPRKETSAPARTSSRSSSAASSTRAESGGLQFQRRPALQVTGEQADERSSSGLVLLERLEQLAHAHEDWGALRGAGEPSPGPPQVTAANRRDSLDGLRCRMPRE